MKSILCLLTLIVGLHASPVLAFDSDPVQVEPETVALWNFDNDSGSTVVDSAVDPIDGLANSTLHEAIPGIDPSFDIARRFGVPESFISFGEALGTKLDFEGDTELMIEAVIHLVDEAPNTHVIFDNTQVQLMVIGNKLTGFVRQQNGLIGLASENALEVGTTYKVHYVLKAGRLALFIDGENVGLIEIDEPVAPLAFDTANSFVGGNIAQQFIPGYVDDVRISSSSDLDVSPPSITQVEPAPGEVVEEPRPEFLFSLSDDGVGVDSNSIRIFLNDEEETGLTVTESEISGQFSKDLLFDDINIVRIEASDLNGNFTSTEFLIYFSVTTGRDEYEADADTLALYHMNEFSPGVLIDESSFENHGFASRIDRESVLSVEGVFDRGKLFSSSASVMAPSMQIKTNQFSFEGWFNPMTDPSNSVIFDTGEIVVERFQDGFVRLKIETIRQTYIFETEDPLLERGKFNHLAITWDGTDREGNNLRVFLNGVIAQTFDAPTYCDFSRIPTLVEIGEDYEGIMDEVRFSSVVRPGFNVPTIREPGIQFNNLTNFSSTIDPHPVFDVDLNTVTGVEEGSVTVSLNDQDVTQESSLTISGNEITGQLETPFAPGINAVEVRFRDLDENTIIKTTQVFHIRNEGGLVSRPEADVSLLVNFDRNVIQDSSNQEVSLSSFNPDFITGVFDTASYTRFDSFSSDGGGVLLGERSFTFESYLKSTNPTSTSTARVMNLQRNNTEYELEIQPSTGTATLSVANESGSESKDFINAFPVDEEWHHVAVVIDNEREYANHVVFIDGEIAGSLDLPCQCSFDGEFDFTSNPFPYASDELVITQRAKYEFSLEIGDKPLVISQSPAAEDTVNSSSVDVEYVFSSPEGISDQGMELYINGVEQEGLLRETSGFEGTLSGTISGLNLGENEFKLVYRDTQNNENISYFNVYYIQELTPGEYTPDTGTLALYHMNEAEGSTIIDSSGNALDLVTSSSDIFGVQGLFNSFGIQFDSGLSDSYSEFRNLKSYTAEIWVNTQNIVSENYTLFGIGSMRLRLESGDLIIGVPRDNDIETLPGLISSSEAGWNHFAVIADPLSEGSNFLVLLNGEVVKALKIDPDELETTSSSLLLMAYGSSNVADEFRLSTVPRYQLVFNKE